MRAVRFHERGGPEVLRVDQIDEPTPGPGEVRVRVRAVGLNPLDCFVRRGVPLPIEMPHIGGADFAGEVDLLGDGVSDLAAGDCVLGYPLLAYGDTPFFRADGPAVGAPVILGEQRNGACCEAIVLPRENLVAMPSVLDFVSAAAVPVAFLTAWEMVVARAGLRPGETLLVLGASGGVGSAAVQIGRLLGARVIACTTSERAQQVRELGADDVIDREASRIDLRTLELTGRRGADVVVESVGTPTWEQSLRAAAPRGRIVTCGATGGRIAPTNLAWVFARELRIEGVTLGSFESFQRVLEHVAAKDLLPHVGAVLELGECRRGHELVEAGAIHGKVVLRVDASG